MAKDNVIKIIKADGSLGSTNKAAATVWPTSDAYATYSGPSDLRGETWSASDINDADFGVAISVIADGQKPIANVDHIRITVYYAAPTTRRPKQGQPALLSAS